VRRRLRMSWGEWTALPWYEQRALRDGLHHELAAAAGVEITDPSESDDALRAAGINVT
jgi:hypothetical protein